MAGLSRDSDDCVSHLCTPPLLAITSWAAKERSQYSPPPGEPGPSSDKALDCMTHWSRVLEPEIVNTASEQAGKSGAWEKEWDSEPQPHEGTPCSSSDGHSMGNRTEFSRMKGRSSGYSEGLLYSWDGIGWQQASRKSHIQGEKRPGRGHQGRLNRILPAVRTKAWHMGCLEGAGRAAFEETESATELWPFCTS